MSKKLAAAEIEKLINQIKKIEERVDNDFVNIGKKGINIDDKVVVFLLGFSRTGKTTLYYALTGKELKVIKDKRTLRLEAVTPEENFTIINNQSSYLDAPVLKYDDKNDIIFCDCPCFSDDRNDTQDIINSFAIRRALSQAKKIKILLLITLNDIESAKGKTLRDSCEYVENLFSNQQYLDSTVALIISKVKPEYSNELLLQNVETGNHELLQNFKKRENGSNKLVFNFVSPSKEMVNNTFSGFENKNQILDFVHDCHTLNLKPTISLSLESKLIISGSIDAFGSLPDLLQQFINQIQYDSSLSDDDIDLWKERIDKLINCKIQKPKDFVDQAMNIIPSSLKYNEIYDSIMKIHQWRSFLEQICPNNELSSNNLLSHQNQAMNIIFLDISNFISERLSPIRDIINNKIKIRQDKEKEENEIQALKNEIKDKQEKTQKLIQETNELNTKADEYENYLNDQAEQNKLSDKQSVSQEKDENVLQKGNCKAGTCLLI